jgi:hypothetical protein
MTDHNTNVTLRVVTRYCIIKSTGTNRLIDKKLCTAFTDKQTIDCNVTG